MPPARASGQAFICSIPCARYETVTVQAPWARPVLSVLYRLTGTGQAGYTSLARNSLALLRARLERHDVAMVESPPRHYPRPGTARSGAAAFYHRIFCLLDGLLSGLLLERLGRHLSGSRWRIHPAATSRGEGANTAKHERRVGSRGRSSLQAKRRTILRARAIMRCCNRVFASPT